MDWPVRTLPVLVSSQPAQGQGAAPRGLNAGFAAQVLGQGGVRRGLRGGPGFVSRAHDSYQAAALARPAPVRARLSV